MPRPRKERICNCPHKKGSSLVFKPAGLPLADLEIVNLNNDELEAFYLCDAQGNTQEEAGEKMSVSRGTVQRLLSSAREKVAKSLVEQKAIAIVCQSSCCKTWVKDEG